jgi:integrase
VTLTMQLPKTITRRDLDMIVTHIQTDEHLYDPHWFWLSVMHCLYYTGMRRRQLVNLTLSDVDFEKKTILLRCEGSKTLREWTIPLHNELALNLGAFIARSELFMGRELTGNDYLFQVCRLNKRYKDDGKGRMQGESVTRFFKRLSKHTGLKIGAHRFRHTLATALCNPDDGTTPDIFVAQAILGHTSLQTTRNYVTTSMQRMAQALNKIA